MTPEESLVLLGEWCASAGLDPEHPDPKGVWSIFKRWSALPVDCDRVILRVGLGTDERDSAVEMYRIFRDRREDHALDVQFTLNTSNPDAPRLAAADWDSEDFPALDDFFSSVERDPSFRAAMEYRLWEFEGHRN